MNHNILQASPNIFATMNDKQAAAVRDAQAKANVNNFNQTGQPSLSTIATSNKNSTINI